MQQWLFPIVLGYLLGSIPFGYLIGKAKGIDVRQYGSGATGGTNVLRTLGWGAAIGTGLGDLLKGSAAAYLGYVIAQDWGYALAGAAALVGHSYPLWLGLRGGKSVATSAGAMLVFHPLAFLAGLVVGLGTVKLTRFVSLGSLLGGAVFCGGVLLADAHSAHKLLAGVAYLVVVVRHWSNIGRMLEGTENKFGQKAQPRPGA